MPNAGTTMIVGNVIEQGPMTENSAIIDYGSEPTGFKPTSDLYVVNNTIVNNRAAGGTFVQIAAMVTTPAVLTQQHLRRRRHRHQPGGRGADGELHRHDADVRRAGELRLSTSSPDRRARTPASIPGMTAGGVSLAPAMQYVHPATVEGRMSVGAIDIGAFELGGGTPLVDGGDRWTGLRLGRRAGDAVVGGVGSHGCSCQLGGRPEPPPRAGLFPSMRYYSD